MKSEFETETHKYVPKETVVFNGQKKIEWIIYFKHLGFWFLDGTRFHSPRATKKDIIQGVN